MINIHCTRFLRSKVSVPQMFHIKHFEYTVNNSSASYMHIENMKQDEFLFTKVKSITSICILYNVESNYATNMIVERDFSLKSFYNGCQSGLETSSELTS
jgi:hypothetical protein